MDVHVEQVQEDGPRAFDRIAWPVLTERLLLRPSQPEDADRLFDIRVQEPVSRWLTRWMTDREEWRTLHLEQKRLDTTVIVELDGVVIGDLMIRIEDAWAQTEVADRAKGVQAELGWVIDPAHAGRGYATEAVRAALRLSFRELGLRRVVAHCFADNTASWRLMERVGMRRETHTVRESLHRDLGWLDGYSYALLADEWEASEPAEDAGTAAGAAR